MMGGFDIFLGTISVPTTPMPNGVSLFDQIETLTEEHVGATMYFKRYYGQRYNIQYVQWSQELIEQSCKEELLMKVKEHLCQIPDSAQRGALFYFILIQLIQMDAEQAVIILTEKLEKFSLKTLSGEKSLRLTALSKELGTV
jgi:hypothetical protein